MATSQQPKERPILFSAPMVRAILDGRKTVTRRAVNPQPVLTEGSGFSWKGHLFGCGSDNRETTRNFSRHCCPFGKPGDRLWVRETWYCDHSEVMRGPYLKPDDLDVSEARDDGTLVYAADGLTPYEADQPVWKPSIHMPRWACRILLEITDVRVERLQDISEEQAKAEGVRRVELINRWFAHDDSENAFGTATGAFRDLWKSTGGDWEANPWVWVVEFKQVTS
ncbi:hypothetical protein [Pseudomonas jessenii]|uniref:Morphogenetic protein n=1 Tax=Pseudomonas jessenii TaxID=77298 RepID=A0A370S1D9_PSEJE|nr:hypothetical protein [Pseudomonas jessenii]RDL13560.1 hypothetical protein DEU51_12437 [Pseudomonas jessenii]